MANTFLRKISNNISSVETSVGNYTVGGNVGAVVIGLSISNTNISQVFANVVINNGVSDYHIIRNALIPAAGALVVAGGEQKIILQSGDSVQVSASGNVDAVMNIMETSEGGISSDPISAGPITITANVSNVNEGNTVVFSVSNITANAFAYANGTYYWTTNSISGNITAADFVDSANTGSFTVTNGSGTILRTISEDATTEGTEIFTISVREGSTSGNIIATSANVTVDDTSLDPVALLDVWSSGGSLGTARSYMGRAGTQTAALGMGGYRIMGNFYETEEYDGSAWASSNNMNTGRFKVGSDGTQTAAIAFGSALGGESDDSEEYDGSSWSSGGTMLYGRFRSTGCGTQTATLAIGASGYPTSANKCDEYDGSSWSAGGDLIGSYRDAASAGTQTAGLIVGGFGYLSSTEEYNGTSWSAGGSLLSGRQYHGAAGLQTAALAFGGFEASSIGTTGSTEKYDGTSWTSGGSLINTAILGQAGTGSQSAGLSFGGYSTDTSSVVAITEEYSS